MFLHCIVSSCIFVASLVTKCGLTSLEHYSDVNYVVSRCIVCQRCGHVPPDNAAHTISRLSQNQNFVSGSESIPGSGLRRRLQQVWPRTSCRMTVWAKTVICSGNECIPGGGLRRQFHRSQIGDFTRKKRRAANAWRQPFSADMHIYIYIYIYIYIHTRAVSRQLPMAVGSKFELHVQGAHAYLLASCTNTSGL